MTIDGNGNVGIGTVALNSKLNIYDATLGPIVTLQGLNTNYRGLKIADTANSEQWFTGTNSSNNYVVRRGGTTDDITIDSAGNVYVTDSNNYRIQKFTSTGTFITKWGAFGTGDGQFSSPQGIAVNSADNVYGADT